MRTVEDDGLGEHHDDMMTFIDIVTWYDPEKNFYRGQVRMLPMVQGYGDTRTEAYMATRVAFEMHQEDFRT